MTNELVIADMDAQYIADNLDEILGIERNTRLPRLAAEYSPEIEVVDDNGDTKIVSVPRGSWCLAQMTDDGPVKMYADTVTFRPYIHTYRYAAYDNKLQEYVLNTVPFKKWGDVVVDSKGGEWVANKYKKGAIAAYPDIADLIKCSHFVYGVVTMHDAVDVHKTPKEVIDVPCIIVGKGVNYGPINDIFKDKRQYILYDMKFPKPKRESSGGSNPVVWYEYEPEWATDITKPSYSLADIDATTLVAFNQSLAGDKSYVVNKYEENRKTPLKDVGGDGSDLALDFVNTDFKDISEAPLQGLMAGDATPSSINDDVPF